MYSCLKRALRILEHSVARSGDHNALTIFGASMRVGDLVIMPGSFEPVTGIILRMKSDDELQRLGRVEVYWIEDAEAAWEPKDWLEVISENR